MKPLLLTTALLAISNAFMTVAWYGHLKFEQSALWKVVLVSWLIASLEYCFQVPANRWGHEGGISSPQLKVMQEVITLVVFSIFAVTYLDERLRWNHFVAFALVLAAVFFVFYGGPGEKQKPGPRHLARPGLSHE
jgi:uncharacterized protein (DUF486 family)